MAIADAVGLCLARTSPHEVKLTETVLDNLKNSLAIQQVTVRINEYLLKKQAIELVAPHRCTKPKTQDGQSSGGIDTAGK